MSAQTELAAYLATQLSLTVGTTVFYDEFPEDAADGTVALFIWDTAPAEHTLGGETTRRERPMLTVMTRHTTYLTGWARIYAAANALVAIGNETVGGVRYLTVSLQSGPRKIKRDANLRHVFSANFEIEKEPSA